MSQKAVVSTPGAPSPIGPFSHGVVHNGIVYYSGTVGMDPQTNMIVDGGIKGRTVQIIKNLSAVLEGAGSSLDKVLKVNVFLTSMDTFDDMNEAYKRFFHDPLPARTCVCVRTLPLGTDVEIECTGYI